MHRSPIQQRRQPSEELAADTRMFKVKRPTPPQPMNREPLLPLHCGLIRLTHPFFRPFMSRRRAQLGRIFLQQVTGEVYTILWAECKL